MAQRKPRKMKDYLPGLPPIPLVPPTEKHRAALWLDGYGFVYARNDDGDVEAFGDPVPDGETVRVVCDYESAIAYSGFSEDRNPCLSSNSERVSWDNGQYLVIGRDTGKRRVLWIEEKSA